MKAVEFDKYDGNCKPCKNSKKIRKLIKENRSINFEIGDIVSVASPGTDRKSINCEIYSIVKNSDGKIIVEIDYEGEERLAEYVYKDHHSKYFRLLSEDEDI